MQILLIAVGRMKQGPEREMLKRYIERAQALCRSLGLSAVEVREIEESRARDAVGRRREEAKAIEMLLKPGCWLGVLDERGRSLTSEAFAGTVGRIRDDGAPAFALVIGGPDGLADELRARCDLCLAYGAATFPHQLVRILAAEQIYRALTILAGHPYHRA